MRLARVFYHRGLGIAMKGRAKLIKQVKERMRKNAPEIEVVKTSYKDQILTYWFVKKVSESIHRLLENSKGNLCWHASQNRGEISLLLSADHFGETWAVYISLLNVENPNSPSNFECLLCVNYKSDEWDLNQEIFDKILKSETGILEYFETEQIIIDFPLIDAPENKSIGDSKLIPPTDSEISELKNCVATKICEVHGKINTSDILSWSAKFRGPENYVEWE